jgi:hypothetical protein
MAATSALGFLPPLIHQLILVESPPLAEAGFPIGSTPELCIHWLTTSTGLS